MDHGSYFFYALEKRRGAKKYINCLLSEECSPLMDPIELKEKVRTLFVRLFLLDPTFLQ